MTRTLHMTTSDTTLDRTTPGPARALRHLVAGRWVDGRGAGFVDTSPTRPDETVGGGNLATTEQLDAAVRSAREALPGWANTPFATRATVLDRAAALLTDHADAWGAELAWEEGKTRAEGIGEVRRAAEILRFYASEALRPVGEVYASPRAGEQIQVVHKPVGVVAVITPFNFPIAIPAWKIAPALAYGNPVVWKPASTVPLLAGRLAEALVRAGLPAGVLNLLIGDGELGGRLVEHPGVDAVTFTGSTAVGRRLIQRCGVLARPIQTEMGGKNAAAVLSDANLDFAADQVAAGAFRSTGQKCTATSRLIVSDDVADDFLRRLARRVSALRVGDPLDPQSQMGPVVSIDARDTVRRAVTAGLARPGVRLVAGGGAFDDGDQRSTGAFLPPTVVEVDGEDELWRDELFGPVLTVRRAADDRQALALINDSEFGLAAAVFTDSLRSTTAAIQTLDVGVLHINSETAGADPHVPFGGAKASGFGPKEQGRAAREFFTRTTTVYLQAAPEDER